MKARLVAPPAVRPGVRRERLLLPEPAVPCPSESRRPIARRIGSPHGALELSARPTVLPGAFMC